MRVNIDDTYRCTVNDIAVIIRNIEIPKIDDFSKKLHCDTTYIPPTMKIIPVYDKETYESKAYQEYTDLVEKFKGLYATFIEHLKNKNTLTVTADDIIGEGFYKTLLNLSDTVRTMLDAEGLIDFNDNQTLIQMKKTKNQLNLNYYYINKAYNYLRSFAFIEESYIIGAKDWMNDCDDIFKNGYYCCKLVKDMNPRLKDSITVMNSLLYIILKIDYNSMVKTERIDYIKVLNEAMTNSINLVNENYRLDCNSYTFISLEGIIAESNRSKAPSDSDVCVYPLVHECEYTNDSSRIENMGRIGDEVDLGNCASNTCSAFDK